MRNRIYHGLVRALLSLCITFPLTLSVAAASIIPWLPFGPDGGDARRFAADPHDHSHLFLGTANGWIYESHDAGGSWKRLTLLGKRDDLIVDSIVVDPADPHHIVVGTYAIDKTDGALYITYDGGVSWISQAEMRGQSIRSLSVAPSDSKVWVAGTLKGVYRSTDGARRWKLISPLDSTEIHEVESIAIDPVDPSTIYIGTWHLPWKTMDAGANWSNIKNGIIDDSDVFSIIIDPHTPKTVYVSACSGIYKSLDAGDLFAKVQGIPSTARRTRVLQQDPAHLATVFAGTTEGLFRSEDAGKTWNRTTGPDIIVNDVFIEGDASNHILIATDRGGVLSSDDGGDTFHSSNSGFSARQITSLRRDVRHPATLYVGVVNDKEWGGVFQSDNGGVSWTQRSQGLSGRDVFSLGQAPDGTVFAGTPHGLYRLDSEAETWDRVEGMPGPRQAEVLQVAPAQPVVATRPPVPVGRNQFVKAEAQHRIVAKAAPKRLKGTAHGILPVRSRAKSANKQTGKVKAKRSSSRQLVKVTPKRALVVAVPRRSVAAKPTPIKHVEQPLTSSAPGFDGSVFSLVSTGETMLATTTQGLLMSVDNGMSWKSAGPESTADWRQMAAAKSQVVASTLTSLFFSPDSGSTWKQVPLPDGLTRVAAIAVEPGGQIWVGGREGIYVSADSGQTWTTPKNLFLSQVSSIFYDESSNRILVTVAAPSDLIFTVQLPQKDVTFSNTGWNLRFVRPVGDHLVAVTPYDGIVIQPKMVASPVRAAATGRQ